MVILPRRPSSEPSGAHEGCHRIDYAGPSRRSIQPRFANTMESRLVPAAPACGQTVGAITDGPRKTTQHDVGPASTDPTEQAGAPLYDTVSARTTAPSS